MDFPNEIHIDLSQEGIQGIDPRKVTIHGGITTFVGPNGSGKTQLMRGLKRSIAQFIQAKKIRFLSAGRLGPIETYRSDFDGQRGGVNYDAAIYGDRRSMARRHLTETVLGDFASLSERPDILIKVQERLKKLFDRTLRVDWDHGQLRVFFERIDSKGTEYSSAREASGLLHLVATLAALYDDEVGCILIDEPEVSLHHQLQSYLYYEMLKVAGDPDVGDKNSFSYRPIRPNSFGYNPSMIWRPSYFAMICTKHPSRLTRRLRNSEVARLRPYYLVSDKSIRRRFSARDRC